MSKQSTVLKLCGADIELGNSLLGLAPGQPTGAIASRALLREIDGVPDHIAGGWWAAAPRTTEGDKGPTANPQDWGRRYLRNGGCAYIDLNHLELCIPEVTTAHDHVATWQAMLRIAQDALAAANERLPSGLRYQVLVNNSDGASHAYGSHLSFLVARSAFDDVVRRRLHHALWLASYQCSSIVWSGQGKVGAENGQPHADFQLSQRGDFFETLLAEQTTYCRPIVNTRDEALCGATESDLARLHCIFFDNTLCHGSSLLKVGVTQCILAMLEAQQIDLSHVLDDPLAALQRWSRDPTLKTKAPTTSGHELTAVEHQLHLLEDAHRFAARGGFAGTVPRADEILALWTDTTQKLHVGNLPALAPRLDWIQKFGTLQRTLRRRPELRWDSPALKHLDHIYSSLDPTEGHYWLLERAGRTEQLVPESMIATRVHEPPPDTRAWTRAMLLRRAGADGILQVDWDTIRFRTGTGSHATTGRTFRLANPLALTERDAAAAFTDEASLDDILDALESPHSSHH